MFTYTSLGSDANWKSGAQIGKRTKTKGLLAKSVTTRGAGMQPRAGDELSGSHNDVTYDTHDITQTVVVMHDVDVGLGT